LFYGLFFATQLFLHGLKGAKVNYYIMIIQLYDLRLQPVVNL
jgi:hypothetical protein